MFIFVVVAFFITLCLAIAVYIGKRKMMTNNHLIKPPKSLESLVINMIGFLLGPDEMASE